MAWIKRYPAMALFAVFIPFALLVNFFVYSKTLFLINTDLDSGGYIFHNYFRTIGYQIFLKMIGLICNLDFTVPIQLNLLLASFLYLSLGILDCFKRLGLAVLVLLICCLDATALAESYLLMTECVFMTALCLTFGALLQTLARPNWIHAALTGAFFVAAYAIRPAGVFLIIPIIFMLADRRVRRLSIIVAAIIPIVLGPTLMAAWNYRSLGVFGNSAMGGVSLAGQTAHLIGLNDPPDSLGGRIALEVAPVVEKIRDAHGLDSRWHASIGTYDDALWLHVFPQLVYQTYLDHPKLFFQPTASPAVVGQIGEQLKQDDVKAGLAHFYPRLLPPETQPTTANAIVYLLTPYIRGKVDAPDSAYVLNPIPLAGATQLGSRTALRAIIHHPLAYASHVSAHVYGMWASLFIDKSWSVVPDEMRRTNRLAPSMPESPLGRAVSQRVYPDLLIEKVAKSSERCKIPIDWVWAGFTKAAILWRILALGLSLAFLPAAFFGSSHQLKAIGCMSVGIWANFGMVAMSVNAIERYAVVMEPVVICLICAGGMLVIRTGAALFRSIGHRRPDLG